MIFFRYLSTGLSFRNMAVTMRIGVSTVSKIVHETCKIVWEELVEEFMPVPTEAHWKKIANGYYERWNFPNCLGSIDGKHCQIKCPANSGSSHFNYLRYFSLVLQGVSYAEKKFITIEVGARGKQSDGGTFAASTLFKRLESNSLNVPPDQTLPGTNIKTSFAFIRDEAYPLKSYLLRPYPSRNLSPIKENFNNRLSEARKCIECVFGIMRAKWRILGKDIEVDSEKTIVIIKCICILHNLIRTKDVDNDMVYYHVTQNQGIRQNEAENHVEGRNPNYSQQAKEVRDKFANFFMEH